MHDAVMVEDTTNTLIKQSVASTTALAMATAAAGGDGAVRGDLAVFRHGFEADEEFLAMLQQVYFMYYNVSGALCSGSQTCAAVLRCLGQTARVVRHTAAG